MPLREIQLVFKFVLYNKLFKTIERYADCELRTVIRFLNTRNMTAAELTDTVKDDINEVCSKK